MISIKNLNPSIVNYLRMNQNLHHFITVKFENSNNKDKMLSVTRKFIEFQKQHPAITILDLQNNQCNMVEQYPAFNIDMDQNGYMLSQLYRNIDVYNGICKITKSTTPIKKVPKVFIPYVITNEDKNSLVKYINGIILFNKIKSTLEKKTIEDIRKYQLLTKLSNTTPISNDKVQLSQLQNLTTDEQLKTHMKNIYTFQNMNSIGFSLIDEAEYSSLYDIFSHFI